MIEKQVRKLMQAGNVSHLIDFLTHHPDVDKLDLGGGVFEKISERELDILVQALRHNTTITKLFLHNNNLKDSGVEKVARIFETNTSIMQLYLGGNDIKDKGAHALAAALRSNKTLRHINLHSNGINDAGIIALAESLKSNRAIAQVYLGANKFGEAGGRALLEMLQSNKSIVELDLDGFRGGSKAEIEGCVARNVKRSQENRKVITLQETLDIKEVELAKAHEEIESLRLALAIKESEQYVDALQAEREKRMHDFKWFEKLSDPRGNSVFLLAIQSGELEFAKELIMSNPDFLSSVTIERENGFLLAIKHGYFDFAQDLLEIKGDLINSIDQDGNNAFLVAIKSGSLKIVEALLQENPSFIESTNRFGNNAFLLAIESDKLELVEYFLRIKPHIINSINSSGTNAFLSAIANNNWAMAERMMSINPLFLSARDNSGNDGALMAAWYGREEILETLLQRNPSFIRSEDNGGNNLFLAAVGNGNFELGNRLLKAKPSFINSVNKYGESAKTFGYKPGCKAQANVDKPFQDDDGHGDGGSEGQKFIAHGQVMQPKAAAKKSQSDAGGSHTSDGSHTKHSQLVSSNIGVIHFLYNEKLIAQSQYYHETGVVFASIETLVDNGELQSNLEEDDGNKPALDYLLNDPTLPLLYNEKLIAQAQYYHETGVVFASIEALVDNGELQSNLEEDDLNKAALDYLLNGPTLPLEAHRLMFAMLLFSSSDKESFNSAASVMYMAKFAYEIADSFGLPQKAAELFYDTVDVLWGLSD